LRTNQVDYTLLILWKAHNKCSTCPSTCTHAVCHLVIGCCCRLPDVNKSHFS